MRRCLASTLGSDPAGSGHVATSASVVTTLSAWSPAASASISTASGTSFPGTGGGLMKRSASIMRRSMRKPGAMRAGFAQFLSFRQDAADNKSILAQGKLQMPVLALVAKPHSAP